MPLTLSEQKYREALDALGSSVEEIAQTLFDKGVRGHKCSGAYCPLAMYLHGLEGARVRVGQSLVLIGVPFEEDTVCISLLGDLSLFVMRFDCGVFPKLIKH